MVVRASTVDYPLIRFGTGTFPGFPEVPAEHQRAIKGWMGRADQSTKVRAMFVTPKQVSDIVRRDAEILKARLVVEGEVGNDRMTLRCEVSGKTENLSEAIVHSIRDVTKLRGEVQFVAPGSLPNDGKVIEDLRKYG